MPLLAAMLLLPATRAVPPAVQDYRTARPCTWIAERHSAAAAIVCRASRALPCRNKSPRMEACSAASPVRVLECAALPPPVAPLEKPPLPRPPALAVDAAVARGWHAVLWQPL
mmetsp:Transcript_3756/g.12412  ORF Transcript_3756/g.12412 Transcript_3756/m.12412 type:complete len:113 (+) Transcript_3756:374-712(+)